MVLARLSCLVRAVVLAERVFNMCTKEQGKAIRAEARARLLEDKRAKELKELEQDRKDNENG